MTGLVRIANCSGFFGDRHEAPSELLAGAEFDFLTGDWLAELTMYLLSRRRRKDPERGGYAGAAVEQLSAVLPACAERGIRIVVNAGGLDPQGCARAFEDRLARLGVEMSVAWLSGDDLLPAIQDGTLLPEGIGTPDGLLTANAYLGARGIRAALDAGADIVVTGRVTDAALVVGPAAHVHGWTDDDWDAVAGALVAGHVIECGTQATGGNFSGYLQVAGIETAGFPIADIDADGTCTIRKAEPSGGAVTVDTVTAQLLYEIQGPLYLSPDVTVDLSGIRLCATGTDRVRISGARGYPPPATLKVGATRASGWRNTALVAVTGPDALHKAELAERAVRRRLATRGPMPAELEFQLLGSPHGQPRTNAEATTVLRVVAFDPERERVDRNFSASVTETALSSFPGFYSLATPSAAVPSVDFVSGRIDAAGVDVRVHYGEDVTFVPAPVVTRAAPAPVERDYVAAPVDPRESASVALGTLVHGRSGDKGGDVNLGLWVDTDERYAWLVGLVDEAFMARALAGEATAGSVTIELLPNLRGLNVVVPGLLTRGAQATNRPDRQGKGFAEYVRSLVVDVPKSLLPKVSGDAP